jgi:hypothetical protein
VSEQKLEKIYPWTLTDAPTLAPAVDYVTGTSVGPFVDTGIEVAFGNKGRLYLAESTIREMAEQLGLFEVRNAVAVELHETEIYNAGYKAGLTQSGELDGLLRTVADRLVPGPDLGADAAPVEGGVAPLEHLPAPAADDPPAERPDATPDGSDGEVDGGDDGAARDGGADDGDGARAAVGGGDAAGEAVEPARVEGRRDVPILDGYDPRFRI